MIREGPWWQVNTIHFFLPNSVANNWSLIFKYIHALCRIYLTKYLLLVWDYSNLNRKIISTEYIILLIAYSLRHPSIFIYICILSNSLHQNLQSSSQSRFLNYPGRIMALMLEKMKGSNTAPFFVFHIFLMKFYTAVVFSTLVSAVLAFENTVPCIMWSPKE